VLSAARTALGVRRPLTLDRRRAGGDVVHPEQRRLQGAHEALRAAVALGLADEDKTALDTEDAQLSWK
jgi:hypothetical protein